MSYIRKIIPPQDKLIAIYRPHWIYILEGILWMAAFWYGGFYLDRLMISMDPEYAILFDIDLLGKHFSHNHTPILWLSLAIGFAVFWPLLLGYISSEIGITEHYVIRKKGIFFIEVDQIDMDDIRAEHVKNGWLGWILGYGRVELDCRFMDDIPLPTISNPYRMVKNIHIARYKHPNINYGDKDIDSHMNRINNEQRKSSLKNMIKRAHKT